MSIALNAPFSLGSASYLDVRQSLKKSEFTTINEAVYPSYFLIQCENDGSLWVFDKSATPNAETGKFSPLSAQNADPFQYTEMPDAEENLGKIAQYIGETDATYTKGYWYLAAHNDEDDTYEWTEIEVQHTPEYTLEEAEETTEGYLKTYQLMKDGEPIEGSVIDIPKDLVIQHGDIKKVVAEVVDEVETGYFYYDEDPDTKWNADDVVDEESEFYNYPLAAAKYLVITITNQDYPLFVDVTEIIPDGTGETKEDVTSNVEVGGVMVGDVIEAGTDIDKLVKLLFNKYYPVEIKLSTAEKLVQRIGTVLNNVVLTATVTKKSEDVQEVIIADETVTDDVTEGGVFTQTIPTIDATTTFEASANDGKKTVSDELKFEFVLPYMYGVSDKNTIDSDADLEALTEVVAKKGTQKYTYTSSNQYCIFAMPAAYPALSEILDQNAFSNKDSFDVSTYTNAAGEEFRIYCTHTRVVCSSFRYDFMV